MCSMHALSTLFSEQLSNINSRTQISNVNKSILHHTCCSTHQNPIQMPATEFWPKEMCKTCNDNRIIFRMLDWFFPLQQLRKRFNIFWQWSSLPLSLCIQMFDSQPPLLWIYAMYKHTNFKPFATSNDVWAQHPWRFWMFVSKWELNAVIWSINIDISKIERFLSILAIQSRHAQLSF